MQIQVRILSSKAQERGEAGKVSPGPQRRSLGYDNGRHVPGLQSQRERSGTGEALERLPQQGLGVTRHCFSETARADTVRQQVGPPLAEVRTSSHPPEGELGRCACKEEN